MNSLFGWLLLCLSLAASVQARVHGYVRDKDSGEALIGANVVVENSRYGAATNLDGYFVIASLREGRYILKASYEGYRPSTVEVVLIEGVDAFPTIELEATSVVLEEVIVTADQSEQEIQRQEVSIGRVRMDQDRIRMAPVLIQQDVLRSFLSVPGVLPSNDFSSELNVRGSAADESLILLDGVEVYNPNHLGGLFSSFIPSAVKHADLVRSSYSAHHGGRLGGVMTVTTRDGNSKKFDGEASLGVLASSLMLAGPLGKKATWMGAVRRSYVDWASKVFTPDNEVPYYFTDMQGRFGYNPGPWDRLSVTGYWGDDVFDTGSADFSYGNRAINLNWRHIWNSTLYTRAIGAFTRYRSGLDFNGIDGYLEDNELNDASLRLQMEWHRDSELYMETGVMLKSIETGYDVWAGRDQLWDVDQEMSEVSLYLDARWRPHPLLILEPGLRLALYRTEGLLESDAEDYLRLEPRFGAKYFLTDRVRFKAAWGIYHQGLQKYHRDGLFFSSVYTVLDETAEPAHAIHYTGGVEFDLGEEFWLEVEGYYKTMHNVREGRIIGDREAEDPAPIDSLFHFGHGQAAGVDLSINRTRGKWTGSLGYSLGWAWRDFDEVNGGDPYYTSFDKRHNANLLADRSFRFREKRGWPFNKWLTFFRYNAASLNIIFRYASGHRYTRPYSLNYLGDEGLNFQEAQPGNYGSKNSRKLKDYSRLDLAWTFIHEKESGKRFECKFGLLNVFSNPNYWSVDFDYDDPESFGVPKENKAAGVSRLPSLELIWKF